MPTAIEKARELEQLRGQQQDFLKAHTNADNQFDMSPTDIIAFNQRNDDIGQLTDEYNALKSVEDAAKKNEEAIKSWNQPERHGLFGGGPVHGNPYASRREVKTWGEMFMESEAFKANEGRKLSQNNEMWQVRLDMPSVNASLKAALTTSTGTLPLAQNRAGVIDYPTRRPAMRDQVPVGDLGDEARIRFVRQNVQTFGADIVAEGATKPETTLGTEPVDFQVEAIAHYIKVTNQALKFIPGIQDLIDRKGTQGILLAEDDKMLNYDGAAGWKGFLKQTGVQSSARAGADQYTAFHQGMNLVMYTGYGNVTGFVIHNNDWHKLICTKDANGRFIYGDPAMMVDVIPRIWGIRGTVTPAITEGTVLAGDFDGNSKWWVAGGIIVKVGYVNDDMIKNQQTIVVEEYAALEIDIPQTFVKLTGWDTIPAV